MINYIYDETVEQRPLILKHLQAYNIVHTGVRPLEDRYFYVTEGKKLVGAIYTHLGWDWVTFSKVYYENIDILKLLLSKICLYFKDIASGITYDGDNLTKINDLYQIGFIQSGIIKKTPKLKEYHICTHTTFDILSDLESEILESSKKDDELDKLLSEKMYEDDKKIKTDMIFIAKDDDTFVGGVHGVIKEDRMYISLLVVLDKYRGQSIGTKLMDLIEEKAKSKGVVCIDLGTCDFQAKPFYEKRGYMVISTLHDYPKGFNEYTLVKII